MIIKPSVKYIKNMENQIYVNTVQYYNISTANHVLATLKAEVTLLHEKVKFHLCLTYKIFVGTPLCDHFVYTENIVYMHEQDFFWANYIEAGLVFVILNRFRSFLYRCYM